MIYSQVEIIVKVFASKKKLIETIRLIEYN